jgi:hypothetical protein
VFFGFGPVDAGFSIVLSDCRSHHRRCGVDPATVVTGSAVLPSSFHNPCLNVRPLTRTSRAHDGSEEAGWPPCGFSAADAWKMASQYTWGSCDRAARGHLRPSPPVDSFAYAFADRRLLCSKTYTIVATMPSIVVELTHDRKGSAKGWSGSPAGGSAFVAEAWLSSRG